MKYSIVLFIVLFTALNVQAQQIEPKKNHSDLMIAGIHLRNSAMRDYAAVTAVTLGTGYFIIHGAATNWAPQDMGIGYVGLLSGYAVGLGCHISAIEMRRKAGKAIMKHEGFSLKASPTAFSLKYRF